MNQHWPEAEIKIDAPIEKVWAIMLDTATYAEWNPFIVLAETSDPPGVGNSIVLHVRWNNGKQTTSPERITAGSSHTVSLPRTVRSALRNLLERTVAAGPPDSEP